MDYLTIGTPTVIPFSFRGSPIFPIAPEYEVILQNSSILVSGSCTTSTTISGGWDVTVTVPSNYQTAEGGEPVLIEVFGNDATGHIRSTQKEFRLIDAAEPYVPFGIMTRQGFDIEDSIVLDGDDYQSSDIHVELIDAVGNALLADAAITISKIQRILPADGVPERFVTPKFQDYKYTIVVDSSAVVFPVQTYGAHQLNYTITDGSKLVKFESHPVYRINHFWIKHLNSLRNYLDKARLTEIDPTLQWKDDELCECLLGGLQYINANKPTLTYWTVEVFPEALQQTLWYAAAYHALNSRYLAEGFTAFDFQGLSTSLTVDRREAITYKIEEIKTYLETNLPDQKKMAVQTVGTGTASDGTVSNTTGKALGVLGTARSPVMNSHRPYYQPGRIRY